MEKKLYIVSNWDDEISIPVKITEEQAKAIEWFIEWADLDYGCDLPENCCAREI